MSATPPLTPAERFAHIIAMMVGMIGARLERPGRPGLAGPLTLAIHIRLTGIRNRIARYVARFQAGTLAPPRPRPATPRPRKARGPGKWDHLPKLPRSRMWLVRLVPGIGVAANHLRILLEDPEMRTMLEAAPQIARTLRPFWHMLSRDPLPPLLPRPRPAPRPAPKPAPIPPAPPQVLTRLADARHPLPQAGEGKVARQRPLSRLREGDGMRAVQPPQPPPPPPPACGPPRPA